MITKEIAAILSLRVYDDAVADHNLPSDPVGWIKLTNPLPVTNGFAYGVFRNENTGEIVISYRGTDGFSGIMRGDGGNNIGLNAGFATSQATQAATVYAKVLQTYGVDAAGSNISFTGHSLGGGLASIMAVWFDRPAIVFDPAPFQATAQGSFPVIVAISRLGDFVPQAIRDYVPANHFLLREAGVQSYYAVGEFLAGGRNANNTVYGSNLPVAFGNQNLGPFAMHSQALLAAGLLSESFRLATIQVQASLPLIMAANFYSPEPKGLESKNFLIDLIRSEQATPGSGKLTHLARDLNKLGTNIGGLSQSAQDAIIAQGIEWYYWQANSYAGQEFITQAGDLLQYTTAIGAGLAGARNKALGYVDQWLATDLRLGFIGSMPISFKYGSYEQWNIAVGNTGVAGAALTANKSQIFIGGGGADTFTGGTGKDFIFGGDSADVLTGGEGEDTLIGSKGSDKLLGGSGNDLYVFRTGDGPDTIVDEGANRIMFNGKIFAGLAIKDAATGQFKFVKDAGKTIQINSPAVLTLDAETQITFQNQTSAEALDGSYGLQLYEESTASTTSDRTIFGDLAPQDFDLTTAGVQTGTDDLGNVITDPNQPSPDRKDTLFDSAGNDDIKAFGGDDFINASRGGNDSLDGGAGDDVMVGRAGDDIVIGGAGADLMRGDSGRDKLYAGVEVTLEAAIAAENAAPSGLKGDFLDGGTEDDVLVGDIGNDTLAGGTGEDILLGGAGDDNVWGDLETSLVTKTWAITRSVTTQGNVTEYTFTYDGVFADAQGVGGDDAIFAGAGVDWVMGDDGDDYIDGGAGDDVLFGLRGRDDLFGGIGNDRLNGDSFDLALSEQGDDYLDGEEGDDQLVGYGGDDQLFGGIGADKLYGDEGVDYLDGEDGDDLLIGGDGEDELFGSQGADFLQGDDTPGTTDGDYLDGGDGNDIMLGVGGSDEMYGGAGADQIVGDNGGMDTSGAADTMYGEAGNDILDGQGGDDVVDGGADNDLLFGGLGNDSLAGGTGNDQIVGGDGDDQLDGGDGSDTLFGEAGTDDLLGGAATDYLIGGAGDDMLDGGDGNDVYYYASGEGNDHISDSGGTDWLVFSDIFLGQVSLGVGSLKLILPGGGSIHLDDFDPDNPFAAGGIEYFQFADGTVRTRAQLINSIGITPTGTPGPDVLSGTALSETIRSLAGDDVVTARGGSDTVYADDGADMVYAGDGNDTVYGGAGDDMLVGEAGDDTLNGEAGNDLLSGGSGTDALMGGDGDDSYLFQVGDGQDTVTDALGQNLIALGAGLTLETVRFGRQGNDLFVAIKDGTDRLTVRDWFAADHHFSGVLLADGVTLDRAAVEAAIPSNLPPVVNADAVNVIEDSVLGAGGNALANDSDPEGRPLRVTNPGSHVGTYGSLSLQADGTYSYTLANASSAVQSLGGSQSGSDSFSYTVTDDEPGGAATAQAVIVVTVTGSNDLPVLGNDVASTAEDAGQIVGNVLANDTDADAGATLTVVDPGTRTSSYGSLAMGSNGAWSYTLANSSTAVQSLGAGQAVTEDFSFDVSDGSAQVAGKLTIAVAGVNDAPTLVAALADQSAAANTSWTWQLAAGSFADVDAGDVLAYQASLADGSALPSWLAFDAATQTFSGRVPKSLVGSIDIRVGVADRLGAQASDVFTLSFESGSGGGGGGGNGGVGSQGNEGVGNGVDGPPPGHSSGFNDGAGTGPGAPGAEGGNGYRPPRREDLVATQPQIAGMRSEAHAATMMSRSSGAAPDANGQGLAAGHENAPGQVNKAAYRGLPDTGITSSGAGSRASLAFDSMADETQADPKGAVASSWLNSAVWADLDQKDAAPALAGQAADGVDSAAIFARWLAVQQSMADEAASNGVPQAWSGGGDTASFSALLTNGGFTGSQRASASDPIGLQAGTGLQQFQGLGQGVREIA